MVNFNSPYLNQSETARKLRLSERTLERMRVEGRGPRFRKFGRRVVYADDDIDAWADARTFTSTAEADASA
jgi:predicted DNA-binding transcriptional regulator AlpA